LVEESVAKVRVVEPPPASVVVIDRRFPNRS